MRKSLSQTLKTVGIVENITIVAPRKHKLRQKIECQRSRGLRDKNLHWPPTTAIYTHRNGKARYHTSFPAKHRIYQTLRIAYHEE